MAASDRCGTGLLGGTFNPPHLGHLAAARHARERLRLERVLLMPARTSPAKRGEPDPGPEARLAMCRLIVAGEDGLGVCAREVDGPGTSYTVDTLRGIRNEHPDADVTFIVGADVAITLPEWKAPREVLALASLAVVARSGADEDAVRARLAELLGGEARMPDVRFLQMEPVEVSSSQAREAAARDEDLAPLVGAAVAGYVAEHRLYGRAGEPA
ncbi:MAG TPA: nicotinate (nicotinamide) nucleotide adenylyltransferase [Solirubrobacteraceae bacterium]|nr:nicotinate (nicotinamide) nucleotide adenylyltransferase [Solirubrobacteraceae bacterium]